MSPRVSPVSCLSGALGHVSLAKILVRRGYLGAQEQVANFFGFVLLFSMRLKMSFLFLVIAYYIYVCIYRYVYIMIFPMLVIFRCPVQHIVYRIHSVM